MTVDPKAKAEVTEELATMWSTSRGQIDEMLERARKS